MNASKLQDLPQEGRIRTKIFSFEGWVTDGLVKAEYCTVEHFTIFEYCYFEVYSTISLCSSSKNVMVI